MAPSLVPPIYPIGYPGAHLHYLIKFRFQNSVFGKSCYMTQLHAGTFEQIPVFWVHIICFFVDIILKMLLAALHTVVTEVFSIYCSDCCIICTTFIAYEAVRVEFDAYLACVLFHNLIEEEEKFCNSSVFSVLISILASLRIFHMDGW